MIKSKRIDCYIDHRYCSGARFSFCDDCKKAQYANNYKEKIQNANTPEKLSLTHIPTLNKESLFVTLDDVKENRHI